MTSGTPAAGVDRNFQLRIFGSVERLVFPTMERVKKLAGAAPAKPDRLPLWIGLGLTLLNWIVYAPASGYGFVNWDDPQYITANPYIIQGLTPASAWWAMTTTYQFYWHPLTWLSYLADFSMFGFNAGGYHAVNVALHAINSCLVFVALRSLTGALWRSAFVAALFAVHPMHVESVAWISERKDVLSGLFGLLALLAYGRYVRHPGWRRYLAVAGLFALGLMAKPMLVTLPLGLLLLDYWPLARYPREPLSKLAIEKAPLFGVSLVAGVATLGAQRAAGAVADVDQVSLGLRVSNAVVSYAIYLGKSFWPENLGPLYPLLPVPGWQLVLALGFLTAVTAAAIGLRKSHPYLLVGWLWFVGMLAPVIGFLQSGAQAYADRFTYLPHVGLFAAFTWGCAALTARVPRSRVAIAGGAVIAILTALSVRQVGYWRDSIALWERALEVAPINYLAHANLGVELRSAGRPKEALAHFEESLRIRPDFPEAHNYLGTALAEQGRLADARAQLTEALRLKPAYPDAHNNLGAVYSMSGQPEAAIREFEASLRLNPNQADAHANLGVMFEQSGQIDTAIRHFEHALRINPQHAEARRSLDRLSKAPVRP